MTLPFILQYEEWCQCERINPISTASSNIEIVIAAKIRLQLPLENLNNIETF